MKNPTHKSSNSDLLSFETKYLNLENIQIYKITDHSKTLSCLQARSGGGGIMCANQDRNVDISTIVQSTHWLQ